MLYQNTASHKSLLEQLTRVDVPVDLGGVWHEVCGQLVHVLSGVRISEAREPLSQGAA